jgi:hypothetical protein
MLSQCPARPALRDPEPLTDAADGVPAAGRAYEFPWAASRRMALSRVRSASTRLSRTFSSFSRHPPAPAARTRPTVSVMKPAGSPGRDGGAPAQPGVGDVAQPGGRG